MLFRSSVRVNLPDSVVVMDDRKSILVHSSAVIYVMKRLGGLRFTHRNVAQPNSSGFARRRLHGYLGYAQKGFWGQ